MRSHFALLFFAQAHQFIVQIDGFQRLDKQRVPAAARAMNHAVNLALLPGHDRHHEAIVPQRDEFLLQRAVVAMRPQESLERGLNLPLLAFDVAAQPMQRHTGIVGDRAIRKNLAAHIAQYRAEDRPSPPRGPPTADTFPPPDSTQRGSSPASSISRASSRICFGSSTAPSMRRIVSAAETSGMELKRKRIADPREAACGCREAPMIGHGLRHVRQRVFQRGAIRMRLQLFQFGSSQRTADIPPHQFAQRLEFQ